MIHTKRLALALVFLTALAATALVLGPVAPAGAPPPGPAQPTVGPGGEKLQPLEIKLPRPLFQGTPKHIKASATLEKYDEKPRPAFLAPQGTKNLALGKKVTSSDSMPIIGELEMVTDGDKEGFDGSYVELGPSTQWVQIDLGKPADLYAILVWHYHAEGRVYHDTVIQVADDPDFISNVRTIYNNDFDNSSGLGLGKQLEYIDDYRGKLIDAKDKKGQPTRARYVRLYSRGNTSNDMNHYVEVEIYGKPAK
jgi:hypothetical protein